MTYGTPFGVPLRPSMLPAAPKPRPTMTWAEMARAEGHRPRLPPSPGGTAAVPLRDRVLALFARRGVIQRKDIHVYHRAGVKLAPVIDALLAEGLIIETDAPRQAGQPRRRHLSLTPTGRARMAA